jgi:O-acetyl-ADP-ribose deacetylase (regulator of RNase III)
LFDDRCGSLIAWQIRREDDEDRDKVIRFREGDLLCAEEDYIAQGVAEGNQEGLGTGLAFKISSKWPDVQKSFKKHARSGRFKAGSIWVCRPSRSHPGFVYLATQPDMYHATLPYLRKSVRTLAKWADENNVRSVGLPKIAAGLGKLSWIDEVKPLLVEYLAPSECMFVVYEQFTHDLEP